MLLQMTELEESLSECRACLKKREADWETQRSHLLQQLTEAKAMLGKYGHNYYGILAIVH